MIKFALWWFSSSDMSEKKIYNSTIFKAKSQWSRTYCTIKLQFHEKKWLLGFFPEIKKKKCMFYLKICFIEVLFSNTSQTCLILCKRFSISLMLSANLLWNMKHSKRSLKFEIPDKSNRNCSGISRGTSTALSLWALIMANSSEKKEKKLVKFSFTKTFLNLARFWQKNSFFQL